jgi:glutamyl-tRNA synthetase
MNNYLALLGWNVGEDDEVVSLEEMVDRFDLSTVSRNPAIFDVRKLEWLNGVYIREMDNQEFAAVALPIVEEDLGRKLDDGETEIFSAMLPLVKERTKLLPEIADQMRFLFSPITEYDEASWSKVMETPEATVALDGASAVLDLVGEWTTQVIDDALRGMLSETELSARKGLQPIRVAVSGSTVSPPLFESLEALGKDETLARIAAARLRLS